MAAHLVGDLFFSRMATVSGSVLTENSTVQGSAWVSGVSFHDILQNMTSDLLWSESLIVWNSIFSVYLAIDQPELSFLFRNLVLVRIRQHFDTTQIFA